MSKLPYQYAHPFPADPNVVKSVAQDGPIGRSLKRALRDLIEEDEALPVPFAFVNLKCPTAAGSGRAYECCDDDNTNASTPMKLSNGDQNDDDAQKSPCNISGAKTNMHFDKMMAKSIMLKFKSSVASGWREPLSLASDQFVTGGASTTTTDALLRGRVRHFNRVGGQWRISVTDAQLRQRENFNSARKKLHRQSLWNRSESAQSSGLNRTIENEMELASTVVNVGDLQILAYDDSC